MVQIYYMFSARDKLALALFLITVAIPTSTVILSATASPQPTALFKCS